MSRPFFEICAAVGVTVNATNAVDQCFSQLLQEDLEQHFIHVQAMQILSAERALQTRIFFKSSKGKVKAAFEIEHPLKPAEKEQALMRRAKIEFYSGTDGLQTASRGICWTFVADKQSTFS